MDEDTRVRAPLNGKVIDLERLAAEVGTPLAASDTEVVVADPDAKITAAALRAAITAHVPPPEPQAVPPLSDAEIVAVRKHLGLAL